MLFSIAVRGSLPRVYEHISFFQNNEPIVFVFPGTLDKFKEVFGSKFYNVAVHEVAVYSIVLVGHQADIDRILKDVALQQQAWSAAYPGTCPKCDGPMLSILFKCGEWQCRTICKNCGTLYHVFNGKLSVYDTKFLRLISIDPESDSAMPTGPFSRKETE